MEKTNLREERLAHFLLQLFFKTPLVNALLVFEDNNYLGVVFKRDVEIGYNENNFNLFENIMTIPVYELPSILFSRHISDDIRIPVIDKSGELLKIISYREFESLFYFKRFQEKFSLEEVFNYIDHPVIVTNHFKRILYVNMKGFEIAKRDCIGWNINELMRDFEIEIHGDRMIITDGENMYHLVINLSESRNFTYHIYQFFLI